MHGYRVGKSSTWFILMKSPYELWFSAYNIEKENVRTSDREQNSRGEVFIN